MADGDEDYMSSAFLDVKEDVRPGLVYSKTTRRQNDIEKRRVESNKLHRTKSRKEMEEENRNAGLGNALTPDNKGFALLQKMGYKPGMKLGKQAKTESGLSEPIQVKLKTDRGGLGREEQIKQRIREREQRKLKMKVYKEKETERLTEEFRERMRSKVVYKNLMGDLRQSQKVCQQLDAQNGVEEPISPWFWFEGQNCDEDDDEDEVEESLDPEEQLGFILDYLRDKYYYCLWCGIKYENEEDLNSNCPGTEKCDHDE